MIDESEARSRILDAVEPSGRVEELALADAFGRIAARSLLGRIDLPGFDNSSMDGYAVRADKAHDGAKLRLAGEQPAGVDRNLQLGEGEAIRIFTGAPVPVGANAVVMQEDVKADGNWIEIVEGVVPGENIRPRGADVCVGQRLFEKGDRITAGRIGLLASQGFASVPVVCRPRVGIVTTGDELIEPGPDSSPDQLAPGQIFNSNAPMLAAQVHQFGGDPRAYHARDESSELRATLKTAISENECVLIAGGVSVGERDLVKGELAALGVESDFWRVRVKPGKPFLFGRMPGAEPVFVFGLPGNPVSAFVTFLLFAAPALLKIQGVGGLSPDELPLPKIRRPLSEALISRGDRPHYLRVKINADGLFQPAGLQQSHAVFGLSQAEAMIRLAPEQRFEAGDEIEGYLL